MRALVALLGLVLGVVAGVSLLLANPLAWTRSLPPLPADLAPARPYSAGDFRGYDGDIRNLLGIDGVDRDLAFPDPALAHVRAGIVVLPAGEGAPAALAIKVSAVASDNSLWRARLGTHDYWNILWSGEGSVFVANDANYWGFARDSFFALLRGGGGDSLAPSYALSARSPSNGLPAIFGASGRYAGFTGEVRELMYPRAPGETRSAERAIAIKASPPPVTTTQGRSGRSG